MEQLIIYDLKNKSNKQRSRILQLLYGYIDKSNYDYSYKRKGLLDGLFLKKEKKTVLCVKRKDIPKVEKILEELKVKFETK